MGNGERRVRIYRRCGLFQRSIIIRTSCRSALTSLGGNSHWSALGATSIYAPTATGFRVYVRFSDATPISPATANSWGWQLNWLALPNNAATPTLCAGQTPTGSTNWQVYTAAAIYLDVNTAGCAFSGVPRYLTALNGSSGHWNTTGATSLYVPTATGFRVYVRYNNDYPLTPADANANGWTINWLALIGATTTVKKYYSSGGQQHRPARRQHLALAGGRPPGQHRLHRQPFGRLRAGPNGTR